jgi:hypothetical protein
VVEMNPLLSLISGDDTDDDDGSDSDVMKPSECMCCRGSVLIVLHPSSLPPPSGKSLYPFSN